MHPTVCIIDDDEHMREVLACLVRTVGLEPEPYDSAESFLQGSDRSGIGCMMLDVQLGGISGLALLEGLSEEQLDFPVFLISGAYDATTSAHARRLGATVVDKPFDARALAQRILAAINARGD
jgi:FixJ family two-component response regulator